MNGGRRIAFPIVLVAAAFLFAAPSAGKSAPPLRVIWSRGPVVYVASADSTALAEGDRVTFSDRGHEIAAGTIRRVDPGALALIALERGALADSRRWKHVHVTNERLTPRTLAKLRIGYPSRENAFAACAPADGRIDLADARYRSAEVRDGAAVLVRIVPPAAAPGWPDTLLMRGFTESGDQEIALERGEIDAAIFWPGELSTRLRGPSPEWDCAYGTRARGVIVAVARSLPPDGSAVFPWKADLHALNREWFRGDLGQPGIRYIIESPHEPLSSDRPRLEVPTSWQVHGMERWWNEPGASPGSATSPPVVLELLDVPVAQPDSVILALATPARGGARVAFTIRCAVATRSEFRHEIRAMGPDAIVNLFACPPARKTP
jgi:hypothetical protein